MPFILQQWLLRHSLIVRRWVQASESPLTNKPDHTSILTNAVSNTVLFLNYARLRHIIATAAFQIPETAFKIHMYESLYLITLHHVLNICSAATLWFSIINLCLSLCRTPPRIVLLSWKYLLFLSKIFFQEQEIEKFSIWTISTNPDDSD